MHLLLLQAVVVTVCANLAGITEWLNIYYQLRQLRPLIRLLSFDAAKLLVQAFILTRLYYCNSLLYGITIIQRRPVPTPIQAVQNHHASSPTREGASTSRPSCSSYMAFSPPTCANQYHRNGVQGTASPPAFCVPGGPRMTANLRASLDAGDSLVYIDTCLVQRTNQHTFWRSLIRCCWTSSMEQSATPAARVRHYTRTIETSAQNASLWSDSRQLQRRVSVFFSCAVYKLAYLLTYLLTSLLTGSVFH